MDDVHAALNDPDAIVNIDGSCETAGTYTLCQKLAAYYGVKEVTSIHTDGSKYVGIWITYKE